MKNGLFSRHKAYGIVSFNTAKTNGLTFLERGYE